MCSDVCQVSRSRVLPQGALPGIPDIYIVVVWLHDLTAKIIPCYSIPSNW